MNFFDFFGSYVSLHLLGHMAKELKTTNFEHLEIVLDSLRSNDLSIKTLALQVLEVLANGSNVQSKHLKLPSITSTLLNHPQ